MLIFNIVAMTWPGPHTMPILPPPHNKVSKQSEEETAARQKELVQSDRDQVHGWQWQRKTCIRIAYTNIGL